MSSSPESIAMQLQSDVVYGSLDFAKFIEKALDVRLVTPIEEIEDIYYQAQKRIKEGLFISRELEAFVNKGCEQLVISKQRDQTYFNLSAHSVYRLRQVADEVYLTDLVPEYFPDTYVQENPAGSDTWMTVMWKWDTVPVERMSRHHWFSLAKLMAEYDASLKENRIADPTVSATTRNPSQFAEQLAKLGTKSLAELIKPKTENVATVDVPVVTLPELADEQIEDMDDDLAHVEPITDDLQVELEFQRLLQKERSESVRFSMMVAQRYLNKARNAQNRGLEFTLTLEDFSALMRNHICYYTHQKLVTQFTEADMTLRRIPDNYMSIDRVNSDLGYTRDNVVVCAHSINLAKSRATAAEFKHLLSVAQLLGNLNPDQAETVKRLMSLNK